MTQRKSDDELAREMAVSAVRLVRWLRAADEAPVLTRSQASALGVIIYSGGISPSALAEFERVHRPTMTRTIAQLVERGLVTRDPDPADARAAILRPTPEGLALWQRGQSRTIAPLASRIAALAPEDRARLEQLLPLLLTLAEPPASPPPSAARDHEAKPNGGGGPTPKA